jgi:enoyl-CoA hydratase
MTPIASYDFDGAVARISLDDGKANVVSQLLQAELNAALDRAEADGAAVVLGGREGRFSAGFDLGVMTGGGRTAIDMCIGGFRLAHRLLSFPRPVVVACTGHALAMGAFLLLGADYRVAADGPFKIAANEVAIGIAVPYSMIELLRARLTPAAFQRATTLAETFDPRAAMAAGFVDEVVSAADVLAVAAERAATLAALPADAHRATKQRARAEMLDRMAAAIERDSADLHQVFGVPAAGDDATP